jgi:hypothetical protein
MQIMYSQHVRMKVSWLQRNVPKQGPRSGTNNLCKYAVLIVFWSMSLYNGLLRCEVRTCTLHCKYLCTYVQTYTAQNALLPGCLLTGQGRIDGALCEYSNEDRLDFLKKLKEAGVTNIEMEATAIGSLCSKAGVAGAIVCVALLDRLHGDQVRKT